MKPVLQAANLTKRFGGLVAVDDVSMDIYAGQVMGLVGDNGAGKSTLIKMISGVYAPDGGQIFLENNNVTFGGPREARDMGIETIYQDLALAENLDVSSNIFLGREVKKRYLGGLIRTLNWPFMHEESATALDRLDIHVPGGARAAQSARFGAYLARPGSAGDHHQPQLTGRLRRCRPDHYLATRPESG